MTTTGQHPDHPPITWDDLANLVDAANLGQWNHLTHPEWHETLERSRALLDDAGPEGHGQAAPAAPAEPPMPPGQFARIELPGYRNHTGWVTEETRFGAQTAVVRDWDGREVAAVALGPGCQVLFLPTPLRRPDPEPLAALPAAEPDGWYGEDDDEPSGIFPGRSAHGGGEPADAFAARVDPEAAF